MCDGYYMAPIYNILFYMEFFYDVFHLSEENWKNPEFYKTDFIHNFSCGINYTTFDTELGQIEEFPSS